MSKICMNQTKKTIRAIGAQYNILTHSLWRFKCSDASNREPSTRHTTHEIVTFFSHPPPPPTPQSIRKVSNLTWRHKFHHELYFKAKVQGFRRQKHVSQILTVLFSLLIYTHTHMNAPTNIKGTGMLNIKLWIITDF